MWSVKIPAVRPHADHLFQPVMDSYGLRLALVFGNHAADGQCPFFKATLCHHCDIGRGEGAAFNLETNQQRLAWYREHFTEPLESTAHLVIYNSGSVLNPAEMPVAFLDHLLDFARELPSVQVISFDSRESFVTAAKVTGVADRLRTDQCVRVILGIESASNIIRNQVLQKEMTDAGIQRALGQLSIAADNVGSDRIGVDVNIVVGGPGTTPQTAADDAAETALFAIRCSPVSVDFNLHPYYPSQRGVDRFPNHPRCSEEILEESIRGILNACRGVVRPRIFVGLNNEGHDTGGPTDSIPTDGWIQAFNATQSLRDDAPSGILYCTRTTKADES